MHPRNDLHAVVKVLERKKNLISGHFGLVQEIQQEGKDKIIQDHQQRVEWGGGENLLIIVVVSQRSAVKTRQKAGPADHLQIRLNSCVRASECVCVIVCV